jgi:hypothetical protein
MIAASSIVAFDWPRLTPLYQPESSANASGLAIAAITPNIATASIPDLLSNFMFISGRIQQLVLRGLSRQTRTGEVFHPSLVVAIQS